MRKSEAAICRQRVALRTLKNEVDPLDSLNYDSIS